MSGPDILTMQRPPPTTVGADFVGLPLSIAEDGNNDLDKSIYIDQEDFLMKDVADDRAMNEEDDTTKRKKKKKSDKNFMDNQSGHKSKSKSFSKKSSKKGEMDKSGHRSKSKKGDMDKSGHRSKFKKSDMDRSGHRSKSSKSSEMDKSGHKKNKKSKRKEKGCDVNQLSRMDGSSKVVVQGGGSCETKQSKEEGPSISESSSKLEVDSMKVGDQIKSSQGSSNNQSKASLDPMGKPGPTSNKKTSEMDKSSHRKKKTSKKKSFGHDLSKSEHIKTSSSSNIKRPGMVRQLSLDNIGYSWGDDNDDDNSSEEQEDEARTQKSSLLRKKKKSNKSSRKFKSKSFDSKLISSSSSQHNKRPRSKSKEKRRAKSMERKIGHPRKNDQMDKSGHRKKSTKSKKGDKTSDMDKSLSKRSRHKKKKPRGNNDENSSSSSSSDEDDEEEKEKVPVRRRLKDVLRSQHSKSSDDDDDSTTISDSSGYESFAESFAGGSSVCASIQADHPLDGAAADGDSSSSTEEGDDVNMTAKPREAKAPAAPSRRPTFSRSQSCSDVKLFGDDGTDDIDDILAAFTMPSPKKETKKEEDPRMSKFQRSESCRNMINTTNSFSNSKKKSKSLSSKSSTPPLTSRSKPPMTSTTRPNPRMKLERSQSCRAMNNNSNNSRKKDSLSTSMHSNIPSPVKEGVSSSSRPKAGARIKFQRSQSVRTMSTAGGDNNVCRPPVVKAMDPSDLRAMLNIKVPHTSKSKSKNSLDSSMHFFDDDNEQPEIWIPSAFRAFPVPNSQKDANKQPQEEKRRKVKPEIQSALTKYLKEQGLG